jgi:hypothetical protein
MPEGWQDGAGDFEGVEEGIPEGWSDIIFEGISEGWLDGTAETEGIDDGKDEGIADGVDEGIDDGAGDLVLFPFPLLLLFFALFFFRSRP